MKSLLDSRFKPSATEQTSSCPFVISWDSTSWCFTRPNFFNRDLSLDLIVVVGECDWLSVAEGDWDLRDTMEERDFGLSIGGRRLCWVAAREGAAFVDRVTLNITVCLLRILLSGEGEYYCSRAQKVRLGLYFMRLACSRRRERRSCSSFKIVAFMLM